GARLLYGMGRSKALPSSFFAQVDPKHHVPRNNVIFIGVIVLIGSFFLTYGRGIELLNFGALIAFMGVNASAFVRYFVREPEKKVANFVSPVLGFFICLGLWWCLSARQQSLDPSGWRRGWRLGFGRRADSASRFPLCCL